MTSAALPPREKRVPAALVGQLLACAHDQVRHQSIALRMTLKPIDSRPWRVTTAAALRKWNVGDVEDHDRPGLWCLRRSTWNWHASENVGLIESDATISARRMRNTRTKNGHTKPFMAQRPNDGQHGPTRLFSQIATVTIPRSRTGLGVCFRPCDHRDVGGHGPIV
jgi:hypothetical protein